MHNIKNNKHLMNNSTKSYSKKFGYYLPIIFIIVILPLITYGKVLELPIAEANFWKGGTIHVDFFNYYKSIFFIVFSLAFFTAFGGLYLNNRLQIQNDKRYFIPIFIYVLMAILSTIFSKNKHVALFGFIEMNQGIFVLLSYILILFILINFINDERDIKVIIYSVSVLVIIEGILGISQYFGFDFLQTPFGKSLITPNALKDTVLNFKFGKYTIYGTMYNTNFIGSFAALVLPITSFLYLYEKRKVQTLACYTIALLAFSLWIGCNSRAGYIGIISSSIIGFIIFRKLLFEKYKKFIFLILGFSILVVLFNTVSNGRVLGQFSRLSIYNEVKNIENINKQDKVRFEEVSINDNTFKIITNYETLIGTVQDSKLSFKDELGNKVSIKIDSFNNITFNDKKYSGYSFTLISSRIKANIYGRNWDLQVTPDQNVKAISYNDKLTYPVKAPRIKIFDGRETFASNRGYIWSRTIPMIMDTIFLGHGPDNYPIVFPQEDYVGRFNVGSKGMTNIIIDKPHNMYMQTAINTGLVSLMALMAIWSRYLIDSIIIYKNRNMSTLIDYMGVATFLSILSYLIAGLFNDSVVSVAPLFWALLGMGIRINKNIREN